MQVGDCDGDGIKGSRGKGTKEKGISERSRIIGTKDQIKRDI